MISLADGEALTYIPKISFMHSLCLSSAFGADLWVQRVSGRETAVISRLGGRLNITADDADFEEIKEFISVLGFSEILTEEKTASALGFSAADKFAVLKKVSRGEKENPQPPSLSALYGALKEGEDGDITLPPFEIFAPDISHRLRHGGAVAIVNEFGGALAFTCSFGCVINGIAVKKEQRGRGLGKKLLEDICGYTEGDAFVCTSGKNADFYTKNGFERYDTAVLIRG